MGKLNEYLKLIPKGISDIDNVIDGIITNVKLNNNLLSEDKQEEITKRRLICKFCPFVSTNARTSKEYLELKGEHYYPSRLDEHCSLCGCPTLIRTAALDKNCGAEAWNEENPDTKIELKWKKYGE